MRVDLHLLSFTGDEPQQEAEDVSQSANLGGRSFHGALKNLSLLESVDEEGLNEYAMQNSARERPEDEQPMEMQATTGKGWDISKTLLDTYNMISNYNPWEYEFYLEIKRLYFIWTCENAMITYTAQVIENQTIFVEAYLTRLESKQLKCRRK